MVQPLPQTSLPVPHAYRAPANAAPTVARAQLLPQTSLPVPQAYRAPAPATSVVARTPSIAPSVVVRSPTLAVASQPPVPIAPRVEPVVVAASEAPPTPGFSTTTAVPAIVRHTPRASEDTILARIIAGLSIPAAELDAAPPPRTPAPPVEVAASDGGERLAAQAAAEKVAADRVVAERKAALDKKAADRKAAADKKVLAAKKAAAEAKAIADREAAEQRKLERANPERIWVQVAGGANEADLPRAWHTIRAKAPEVFGSRAGWSTPLRATNRVLAGPFKTADDARDFVNDLKKKGVPAFTFTSDAGQPVAKLPK